MSALLELLKAKKQAIDAGRKGRTAKIPDGNSRWRILDSWRGADQPFWHDFGQHFIKDSTGTMKAVYVCTEKTFARSCAVCEAVAQGIKGATDDATMKILQDAKSAGRVLVNALQLDSAEPHKVHILELAPTAFEQIVSIAAEWEEAGESVLGASGKDIIINRTGTGKQTKYVVQVGAKATAVPASVCEKMNNLDEYVAQESTEHQQRALSSVRAVAGLLPAPGAPSGLPLAAAPGAAMIAEDLYAAAPSPRAAAAPAAAAFEDVPDLYAAAPAPVKTAPAAAPSPAAAASVAAASAATGDADLDELLASLGD